MFKNNFPFIDCSQAVKACDKVQYKEAGTFERLKLQIHLLFCSACRSYTNHNNKLTRLLKKAKLKFCTRDEKNIWKEKIKKEMPR